MTDKQDIETLLPWHMTERLEAEDQKNVEAYLADHPEMANQLDLIREEREETTLANEALGAPSPRVLDNILTQIEAEEQARPVTIMERISSLIPSFELGGLQLAGLAATLVIVAQAAIIGALLTSEPSGPGTFETANRAEQVVEPDFLIAFGEKVTTTAMAELLDEFGLEIVGGPNEGGIFKLRLIEPAKSEEAKDELVEKLQSKGDLVRFVSSTQ